MNIIQFRLYSFFSPDEFKRNPNIFVGHKGVVGSTVLTDDYTRLRETLGTVLWVTVSTLSGPWRWL